MLTACVTFQHARSYWTNREKENLYKWTLQVFTHEHRFSAVIHTIQPCCLFLTFYIHEVLDSQVNKAEVNNV